MRFYIMSNPHHTLYVFHPVTSLTHILLFFPLFTLLESLWVLYCSSNIRVQALAHPLPGMLFTQLATWLIPLLPSRLCITITCPETPVLKAQPLPCLAIPILLCFIFLNCPFQLTVQIFCLPCFPSTKI